MSLQVFLLCATSVVCATAQDKRRPLFVFGHMANTLEDLDEYIQDGANAIEADFTFAPNGSALKLYHGPINCFCGLDCEHSIDIPTYLTFMRDSVGPGGPYAGKLLLFYADTKTDNLSGDRVYAAGVSLAQNLIHYLWMNVPYRRMLNVIVSIFQLKDKELLRGALDTFLQTPNPSHYLDHVGFDVGGYNLLNDIAQTYKELGIYKHRWQGDGAINCLMTVYPTLRTSLVIRRRTSKSSPRNYVDKSLVWTVDEMRTIRRFLRKGIDGIITNKPANVLKVLSEKKFARKYRLAKRHDNPWLRIP
uniref:GP-PDE domain-containing protein n=1 Tax=Amblyomma maculatum TaxID=34609 RepID=G3MT54_AMBMU